MQVCYRYGQYYFNVCSHSNNFFFFFWLYFSSGQQKETKSLFLKLKHLGLVALESGGPNRALCMSTMFL